MDDADTGSQVNYDDGEDSMISKADLEAVGDDLIYFA